MFLKTKWIFVCNGSSYCLLTDKYIKFKTFYRFPSFSGLPSRWRDSPRAPRFLPNRFPIRFGDFRAPARSFWERRRPRSSSGQWCDSQGYPLGSVGEAVWSPFLGLGRSSLVGELPLSDLGQAYPVEGPALVDPEVFLGGRPVTQWAMLWIQPPLNWLFGCSWTLFLWLVTSWNWTVSHPSLGLAMGRLFSGIRPAPPLMRHGLILLNGFGADMGFFFKTWGGFGYCP